MPAPTRTLFGISKSNLDFSKKGKGGWGKNKFNNAFPISLLCFLDSNGFDVPLIAASTSGGRAVINRTRIAVADLLGAEAEQCRFEFEGVFPQFVPFVDGPPNKSDVIVYNGADVACRALEIKLTVVPDQTTLQLPRASQASEFVTRPLMIELLATNICMAFGASNRPMLNNLLLSEIGNPNNWNWRSEDEMYRRLPVIRDALETLIVESEALQTPMVVQPIWRTIGDSMQLDRNCFDVFCWTDYGLALLYLQSLGTNIRKKKKKGDALISRESRSAIWLIKMLWDYSTAGQLTMSEVVNGIAYRHQQDKAGAFSGRVMLDYLKGPELTNPRVRRDDLPKIVLNGGEEFLNPERRLDATIFMETAFARRTPTAS